MSAQRFPPKKHACPDCSALHWRPDEREAVRKRWETCADCGKECCDDYMVTDEVWTGVGMRLGTGGGVLHLDCLAKRLNRPMTLDDFSCAPVNGAIRWAWSQG